MGRLVWLLAGIPLSIPLAAQGSCRATGKPVAVQGLAEASGVAASSRTPGLLWSHNDSAEPILVAVSAAGEARGRVRVTGARVGDWEAVTVGSCPGGPCLYIGDIGDNTARRRAVTIYRVPEPEPNAKATVGATALRVTYPDGPQDAEALFALPNGNLYIVTKGEHGPVAVYRVPSANFDAAPVQLERVATVVAAGRNPRQGVASRRKVTDASASADGRWVALRTNSTITFYAAAEFVAGRIREAFSFDVSSLREPQGEGIAFGVGRTVWLMSEGGAKGRPGTLTRLDCALP